MDSRATQQCNVPPFFFNLLAATSQFSVCIGQKMQLNGWDNGKDMHIAKCADTNFS